MDFNSIRREAKADLELNSCPDACLIVQVLAQDRKDTVRFYEATKGRLR
jgi:hypothetical protein